MNRIKKILMIIPNVYQPLMLTIIAVLLCFIYFKMPDTRNGSVEVNGNVHVPNTVEVNISKPVDVQGNVNVNNTVDISGRVQVDGGSVSIEKENSVYQGHFVLPKVGFVRPNISGIK